MKDLVSYGEVRHAWIGLVVQDLTPDLAQHFGVRRGVVVAQLDPKSPPRPPASRAATRSSRWTAATWPRERSSSSASTTHRGRPDHADAPARRPRRGGRPGRRSFPPRRADELAWQLLGVAAAGAEDGLFVSRVRSGSPAARIGVQRGDRLLGLGGTPLRSIAELRRR